MPIDVRCVYTHGTHSTVVMTLRITRNCVFAFCSFYYRVHDTHRDVYTIGVAGTFLNAMVTGNNSAFGKQCIKFIE